MRPATPRREPEAHVVPRQQRRIAGAYQALHGYLDRRYADTAVLTFEQIESLLGFSLPEQARTDDDWWVGAGTDAVASAHADASDITWRIGALPWRSTSRHYRNDASAEVARARLR